jgi:hypothetical protein
VYVTMNGVNDKFGDGYPCKAEEMKAKGNCNFAGKGSSEDVVGVCKGAGALLASPGASKPSVAIFKPMIRPALPSLFVEGLDF